MKAAKQGWFPPNPTGVTSGSSTAWGDQTDPFQWRVEVLAHAVPALRSGRGVLREMVDICWLICWYMLIYVDICWYMLDICWWICWLICWFKNGDGSKFFSKMHGLIWFDWLVGWADLAKRHLRWTTRGLGHWDLQIFSWSGVIVVWWKHWFCQCGDNSEICEKRLSAKSPVNRCRFQVLWCTSKSGSAYGE